jgi:hypothetical protein
LESTSADVIVAWDVLEFDPHEVTFVFSNLSAVSIHRVLDAIPLFVDLLDDNLGITES